MMANMLRALHLSKTYKSRQVVKDVSVHINGGEVVGLLGPNGAGKTTSFYMIVGLIPVDGGKIYHLRKRGMGILITDHNVRDTLNICERAYIVNQGKIICEGNPEMILMNDTEKIIIKIYVGVGWVSAFCVTQHADLRVGLRKKR